MANDAPAPGESPPGAPPNDWDAGFAEIYDAWTEASPVAARDRPFYVGEYLRTVGPVVELGVGTGRIAVEAARKGKAVTGVDSSARMLELCARRAEAAGVADRLTLIRADFRDFTLPEPAALVALPHRTIVHLLTPEAKEAALARIHAQLAPGGRVIFDAWVDRPEHDAPALAGVPRLRAEWKDPRTGRETLLWETTITDRRARTVRLIACLDELAPDGTVAARRYRRVTSSWFDPEEMQAWATAAGFEVEALFGDWSRTPLYLDSTDQIWVLRKPG